MRSLRSLRRSSRVIREQVGLRRFLKLADPYLGKQIDRIQPQAHKEAVLIVAPHADDEAIGCGGAFALHRKRGDDVLVLYTTNSARTLEGQQFDPDYKNLRKQEAQRSIEILGGAKIEYLDLPDKEESAPKHAIEKIVQLLLEFKPDRIYVPWALDSHRDHQAAFRMVQAALSETKVSAPCTVWQYEVWTPLFPNRYVPIREVLKQKENAIAAHASQLAQHDYLSSSVGLATYRGTQGNVKEPAEAYFAVPAKMLNDFANL